MRNGKRKLILDSELFGGDPEESAKKNKNEEPSESIISLLADDEEEEHSLNSKDLQGHGNDTNVASSSSSSSSTSSLSTPTSPSSSSSTSTSSSTTTSSSPSSSTEQPNSLSNTIEEQNNSSANTNSKVESGDKEETRNKEASGEESVSTLVTTVNYKRMLMERLLSEPTRCPAPAYVTKAAEGKGYEAVLSFVLAGMETVIVGRGATPKAAEQDAARQAIEIYPTVRASAPLANSSDSSSFSSLANRSVLTSGVVVHVRENANYISNVYSRLKASYSDPTAKPVPDYYSYKMNGQKSEWETSLKFTLGNGKSIRSIGRGPTKLDSERDAARRALEKPW